MKLTKLPNIADKLASQLADAGIETAKQLQVVGSKEAWLRILAADPSACYMRLCALEGAIRGIRWHHLPDEVKKDLKEFYLKAKGSK